MFSWRLYGLGVAALGLSSLAFGDFDPGQHWPEHLPHRTALAYAAGALMTAGAAAVAWRRATAWGAALLAAYYALIVAVLDGRLLLTHYSDFGTYEDISMQLAIALGGLIVYAGTARIGVGLSALLTRISRLAFGVCALIWGGAHFVYMNLTAPLVPRWLPPGQVFWGYVTGACFIAAGLGIITGLRARLAAVLLTVMIACFGLLVNDRILFNGLTSHWNWSESSLNLALTGVSWAFADSFVQSKRPAPVPEGSLCNGIFDTR